MTDPRLTKSLAEAIKRPHGRERFLAGLVVVACCVLGGLYFLFRHASHHDKFRRRKPPLANWK